MDLDNPAADMSGLGIPGNVIADFEAFCHLILPNAQWRKPVQHAAITAHGHASLAVTVARSRQPVRRGVSLAGRVLGAERPEPHKKRLCHPVTPPHAIRRCDNLYW